MLWFLRLFRVFRDLESEQRKLAGQVIQLQDQARWSQGEISGLSTQLKDANARADHSTRLVADFFCQWVTGKKLYDAAPDLPAENPDTETVPRQRVRAREVQQQEQAEAYAQMLRSYEAELEVDPDAVQ